MKIFFALFLILVASCKPEVQTQTSGLKLLGYTTLPFDSKLDELPLGGFSGMISLDTKTYMAIIDDRSELGPARMVKLNIDFENNELKVKPVSTVILKENNQPYKLNTIDPEAIVLLGNDYAITSEGSYRGDLRSPPFINVYNQNGVFQRSIEFNRDRYIPESTGEMTKGIRPNLGFESLSLSPSGQYLFTVNEAALRQDSSEDYYDQNLVRLSKIDLKTNKTEEFAIKLDNIFNDKDNGQNGISDILAISNEEVLFLERAWISSIKKQVVKIFKVKLDSKALVTNIEKLTAETATLEKTLVLDFSELDQKPDNLEILCFGPMINENQTLIVASDNNFSKHQKNQFYLFEILSL
ncbi:MAG: hypothetical protein COW01_10100 [Bdellovibrionales bacterium CG12_big_fil_rev_8_21_14_0_65_38_15]|nr:MAG: hypothetical protein COW79_06945 [Bdellovibrionales bacterium CG22_combo_CG10-13_8_21_14_all_38_13]PIQ54488.1 MAG: hypothetical protein COW01_10100 [Bdellovibrionales bacterium CG12_big_fil_rev_8_21_14_0_65_38_15]PIR29869.1 MAG: hypothetical protein COV38_07945 [Bdellovibrionales bacterium CG11_big_fil_rev_8_21_14_0_20_38_13]